jgi:hypothetical protein
LVVLDGSDSMASSMKAVCDSIQNLACKDATLVWAADQPTIVTQHVKADGGEWAAAISKIRDSACVGGQDNAAALQLALEKCLPASGANIVWLHGPQTIKFSGSKLAEIWKAHSANSSLYEYQAVLGPNESIRSLDSSLSVNVVPHFGGINEDLKSLFKQLDGSLDVYTCTRKFIPNDSAIKADAPAFLTQLCTSDLVGSELEDRSKRQINSALAETYRIVTPLTSCVVLLDPPAQPEVSNAGTLRGTHQTASSDYLKTIADKNKPVAKEAALKKSLGGDANSAGKVAIGEAAQKVPAMQQSAPGLIPTKPEPPLSLLMFCAGLASMALMFLQKSRKKKCL